MSRKEEDVQSALDVVKDYVERTTRWQEGGADRHSAKLALDVIDDGIEWIEKGLAEWRDDAQTSAKQAEAARATARVAIGHLQQVLNGCRTADEQQRADSAARDWLASIGA